ncbi:MAG: hypothetical protein ACREMH_01355 [Gemmatimonadales bacterium]
MAGLPTDVDAEVTVSGPNGFSRTLTGSETLSNLRPGNYTIAAQSAQSSTAVFGASPSNQVLSVEADQTSQANVTYAQVSGSINVTIGGLPPGVDAVVRVSRPPAFTQTISGSATLSKLLPGTYSVTADTIDVSGTKYVGTPRTQTAIVVAGPTPSQAVVSYTLQPGSLRVVVTGLPLAYPANVTVTGPGGYNQTVTATTTFTDVPPGSYTVAAEPVMNGPDTFNPAPTSQGATVTFGAQSLATVTYTSTSPATLNLSIPRFYVTQATQRTNGTVPLVAGRAGLVRVFVVANQANSVQPDVRVRFWQGATMVQEVMAGANQPSVPVAAGEEPLEGSWNIEFNPGFLVPGMSITAEVDPANEIPESAEGDNAFTLNQQPVPLDIRNSPTWDLTLVPVFQNNLTGDVTDAESWISFTRRIHPMRLIDVDVHSVYSTEQVLLSNGGGWIEVLNELQALKLSESSTRYYYGALDVPYDGGVVGLGFLPNSPFDSPFRVAMGWDEPSSRDEIAAHEWGHNFGRLHAPSPSLGGACPTPDPASIDVSYPYPNGIIGVTGYDLDSGDLVTSGVYDVMGYCDPQWISDYTYTGVMGWRAAGGASVASAGAPVDGLLVWGRIVDGNVALEPAFQVRAPASPSAGGWSLELTDESGALIGQHRFAVAAVADFPSPASTFAFVVPMDQARHDRVTGIKVRGPGGQAELRATPVPPGAAVVAPAPAAERAAGRVRVRWDAARFGAALVRDATTGEVLAIGRGGDVLVATPRGDLDVTLSDGVRNARQRVQVR